MLNKNFLRRGCLVITGILFLIFLMQYNKIEKTELLSTEGRTFEKAVVTEVISDNLTENGNRVGNQTVRLRLCSGKFKNEKVEAISSSSYLFGATCKKGMKVIALVSESQGEVILIFYDCSVSSGNYPDRWKKRCGICNGAGLYHCMCAVSVSSDDIQRCFANLFSGSCCRYNHCSNNLSDFRNFC